MDIHSIKFQRKLAQTLLLFITPAMLSLYSCEEKRTEAPVPTPSITSLSPSSGIAGTLLIITGANFSETILSNTAMVNGKPTPVTAASFTSLTVSVPIGAGTGPVTVKVGDQTSNELTFTYVISEVASTLAGKNKAGYLDGNDTTARFKAPLGVAVDAAGNLYIADSGNQRIRKISPAGTVTTFAGSGKASWKDGSATEAEFYNPSGVAVDATGNVYVADYDNHRIRKITPAGVVSTLAGGGNGAGYKDSTGTEARFAFPTGVAVDKLGNVFVADRDNQVIRKITATGEVTTLAGKVSNTGGYADGAGTDALFNAPVGLAVDANNNVYVAEFGGHRIRKITQAGVVSTIAGNGTPGFVQGSGTTAQFNKPAGVAIDKDGALFIADVGNNCIRKVSIANEVSLFAGSGIAGANTGPVAKAEFNYPISVAIDASGFVYVAEANNHRISKVEKK
jgi:sugar lactone lactonase YvrE